MASWRSEHRDARQVTELEGPVGPQGALGMHHAMPTPWQGSRSQEPPPAPILLCPRAACTQEREINGHHWLFHPSFLGSFSAPATLPGSGPPRPDACPLGADILCGERRSTHSKDSESDHLPGLQEAYYATPSSPAGLMPHL